MTTSTKNDISPFIGHLQKLFPNPADQETLLSFMSACVQYPHEPFKWGLVIQGAQGCGKTVFSEIIRSVVGGHELHLSAFDQIKDTALKSKKRPFIQISDIDGFDMTELKSAIVDTGSHIIIESNSDLTLIGASRRFRVLKSPLKTIADLDMAWVHSEYFINFREWLLSGGIRLVGDVLKTRPISDEANPLLSRPEPDKTEVFESKKLRDAIDLAIKAYGGIAPVINTTKKGGLWYVTVRGDKK